MSNQTIGDTAKAFQPKTTKNITELTQVPVNVFVQTHEGIDDDGKKYSYYFIEVGGEKYRLPVTVLSALKQILTVKPTLKTFRVTKTGEGRGTKYTVIPLE